MHEIGTAFFHEELHCSRRIVATIETVVCCIIAILCALSCGAYKGLSIAGRTLLDFCDFLTAQILMPVGALATCLLIGWFVPKRIVRDEFTNRGTTWVKVYGIFLFIVRFVCPVCIIAVFLHQAGVV